MKLSSTLLAICAAAATLIVVDARPEFVSRIPNGANVPGVEAVGHVDTSGGGARNAFGEAFDDAGRRWTTALCQADSDGDGQTNGQELGDPCCVWTSGGTPRFTTGVSHPGDATRTVVASVLASNSCATGGSSSTNSTTTTTTTPSTTTAAPSSTSASSATTTTPAPTTTTAASGAASLSAALTVGVVVTVAAFSQW